MPLFSNGKLVASVSTAHTAVSPGPLDICKTPAPPAPAPIPMPYPNVAVSTMMGPGYSTKTFIVGTPAMTSKSKIAISNGMQPGVALGLISNQIMGMAKPIMTSFDVKVEGGGVVRTLDKASSNGDNCFGSNFVSGAGMVVESTAASPECKVFKAAVADWCSKSSAERKKTGKFNDFYFKHQDGFKDQLGKNFVDPNTRETLLGAAYTQGTSSGVVSFVNAGKSAGPFGQKVLNVMNAIADGTIPAGGAAAAAGAGGNIDASRLGRSRNVRSILDTSGTKVDRVLFADGVRGDGTVLEIKGPHDRENPPGQTQRYADVSANGQCVVVSCQSCGIEEECKSGTCSRKKKK